VTGFNAFGDLENNPSRVVAETLAARTLPGLVVEVLPTEYDRAGARIRRLIAELRPARILCLGVNMRIGAVNLERVALNVDDAALADNAGVLRSGVPILRRGPLAYLSTLPLEGMLGELRGKGIPSAISNHAGTFVCNHVFYLARHTVASLGLRSECGFVHLPPLLGTPEAKRPGMQPLALAQLTAAVDTLIRHRPGR
jgi:pyroglutamyl-peptidase